MKWVRFEGTAHAEVEVDLKNEETYIFTGACSGHFLVIWHDDAEIVEVKDFTARPFGVDTCVICHGIVKGWHAKPETAPAGLVVEDASGVRPIAMAAANRRAAIEGTGTVVPAANGAQVPVAVRAGRGSTVVEPGDDLEWPDEPVTAPIVAGALVVPVKPKSRRAKVDIEIDSD